MHEFHSRVVISRCLCLLLLTTEVVRLSTKINASFLNALSYSWRLQTHIREATSPRTSAAELLIQNGATVDTQDEGGVPPLTLQHRMALR